MTDRDQEALKIAEEVVHWLYSGWHPRPQLLARIQCAIIDGMKLVEADAKPPAESPFDHPLCWYSYDHNPMFQTPALVITTNPKEVRDWHKPLYEHPAPVKQEVSNTTQQLIDMLTSRDAVGRAKYGTTLDRQDLSHVQWLQHMAEEMLDGAGYALAAIRTSREDVQNLRGYMDAFFDIAQLLDIGARVESPAVVWETEMRPKLEALVQMAKESNS